MNTQPSEKLKYLPKALEAKLENEKEGAVWFNKAMGYYVGQFNEMWDILKAVEEEYSIGVMGVAKRIRNEQLRQSGSERGRKAPYRGILRFYNEFVRKYEGIERGDLEYIEFNDERLEWRFRRCPLKTLFKGLGRTDEELAEMSELLCMEIPKLDAFDPELEVSQTSNILRGDDYCTYIVRKRKSPKE